MNIQKDLGTLGLIVALAVGIYIQFGLPRHNDEIGIPVKTSVLNYIQENKLLILGVVFVLLLIVLVIYKTTPEQRDRPMTFYTPKMDPQQYEIMKKVNTLQALKELKKSKEYHDYYNKRKAGTLKPIELDEDDRIVLSDDSTN